MNKSEIISISMSNTKMGCVPSFSLPPVITCSCTMGCSKRGCYAKAMCARRKSVRESYDKNLRILQSQSGLMKFATQLNGWLSMYSPKAFRFHVSGDFFDVWYLDECCSIAKMNPKVKFFAFTKQFDVLRKYLDQGYKIPKNFSIILSAWLPSTHNWCPPEDLAKKFPIVWVFKTGKDVASITDTAWALGHKKQPMMCEGHCEECGRCFSLKRKDGDVVIQYH